MTKDVSKKRKKAILGIAGFALGNVVFSGAPKPGVEIPSHIVLTGADFIMCYMIYHTYFGDSKISNEDVIETLGVLGIVMGVAGGGGYAIAKSATGLVAEVTNFLGPLGWMASGLLAAGGTAALGLAWLAVVEWAYSKNMTLKAAAKAMSNALS